MNSKYHEYKIDFEDALNDGITSFDDCSRGTQERLARNYWLSFDWEQRAKFSQHIDEIIMQAASSAKYTINQAMLEELLIEFYGPEIDKQFKAVNRRAA